MIKKIIIAIFYINSVCAQIENTKWYFGFQAALDFSTSSPSIINNSMMKNCWEGSSSVSDQFGNLLFYTDGDTVWNQNNLIMSNGTGLYGRNTSCQGSLIVKQPGNSNIYYVFTTDGQGDPAGLCYSTIDMNLSAGLGSVTFKNTQLVAPSTEKLTGIQHSNGTDVWVLSHEIGSNNFRAYLVSSSGIGAPVISSVGTIHTYSLYPIIGGSQGNMIISPNGKRIAISIVDLDAFELYDFNMSTGLVSNPLVLGTNFDAAYGVAFSPDSKKLYGTRWAAPELYQWDICDTSSLAIKSSSLVVATTTSGIAGLALAPNGKIYVARNGKNTIGRIDSPNSSGVNCNYIDLAQSLGTGSTLYGLPNLVVKYDTIAEGTDACIRSGVLDYSYMQSKINIYPNPTEKEVNVKITELDLNGVLELKILNKLGMEVKHLVITNLPQKEINIIVNDFEEGVYILQFFLNGELIANRKLAKN